MRKECSVVCEFGPPRAATAIVMFQDNKGVVDTVLLDSYRHRLRHQMNAVSIVRGLVRNEVIKVVRLVACKTQRQLADLGTKVLGRNTFQERAEDISSMEK